MKVFASLFVLLSFSPSAIAADAPPPVSAATLKEKALALKLAADPQWLKLGHYRKGIFGGYTSQAIGAGFFLSPDGRENPEKELNATIEWLFETKEHEYLNPHDQPDHQFARCQFPARTLWLERKLGFADQDLPAATADCKRYDQFVKSLQAKSVSLVFSSYYLNNPSSAFGHSFLRVNKSEPGERNHDRAELFDHGVNFAAEVTTDNALLFAINGLLGFFRGTYSNVPYYYKVREYNDYESRDLWSYDLNLTPEELTLLVGHLWELGSTYFSYYYFTQNCSFQILTAIEAVAPRYDIVDGLRFYVIPGDTIKRITEVPGLVGRIDYRPSVRAQFQARFATLSQKEKRALFSLVVLRENAEPPKDLALESRVKVLDAALDYMDYRFPSDLLKQQSVSAQWKQKLLLARAEAGTRTVAPTFSPTAAEMPQAGHGSARFGALGGYEKGLNGFSQLEMRFALHDLLDPGAGYPRDAQIEFFNLRGRYYFDPREFNLQQFDLIRITSLNPIDAFDHGKSWRVQLGLDRVHDDNCANCLAGTFQIAGGYSVEPFGSPAAVLFGMGEAETSYAPDFIGSKGRVGVGPAAGLLLGQGTVKAILSGHYRYEIFAVDPNVIEASSELRWSLTPRLALDGRASVYNHANWESAGGVYYYF